MNLWSRTAYLVVTGALAAAALAVAAPRVAAPGSVAVGVSVAWALQAPSFWTLAGALDRSRPVLRTWTAGIAARLGGLAVLAVAGGRPELARLETVVAYALTLVVYLLLEAFWLWQRQPKAEDAENAMDDTLANGNG